METADGNIAITTGGGLEVAVITAGNEGNVVLTATGDVTRQPAGKVSGGLLTVAVTGAITLTTAVARADFEITGPGDIVLTEENTIDLINLTTGDGSIDVTAGSDIIAARVRSLHDDPANAVTLTSAGGDLLMGMVQVGSHGRLTLDAAGLISRISGTVTADVLTVRSGSSLILDTAVNVLIAEIMGIGNLVVNETDAIALQKVETVSGAITITAGGTIQALDVASRIDNEAFDIRLTSTGGDLAIGSVNAGILGDVTLAVAGAITDLAGTITADVLVAEAHGGMTLNTAVNRLQALTLATGDLVVTEAGGLTDVQISVFDGSADLTAGGGRDVILTTGGAVHQLSGTIVGSLLTVRAGRAVSLVTAIDRLDLETAGAGGIEVVESDDLEILHLLSFDGAVFVDAGGTLTALSVMSSTDGEANDITLQAGGDLSAGHTDAAATGDVTLVSAGAVSQTSSTNTSGRNLFVSAVSGLTLVTQVASLTAALSGPGDIHMTETGAIDLTQVRAADGAITVTAGDAVQAMDLLANQVTISTGADLSVNLIDAGTAGHVILTASGAILGGAGQVTAGELTANADSGITLMTTIARLSAVIAGAGDITVVETDELEVTTATTAGGLGLAEVFAGVSAEITLIAAGAITGLTGKIRGRTVTAAAGSSLRLDTEIEVVNALSLGGGSISISESDALRVEAAQTPSGSIDITAGGDLDLHGILAGSGGGVALRSVSGAIKQLTGSVTGGRLSAVAAKSIKLSTTVTSGSLEVRESGDIELMEADDLILPDVSTADGAVRIIAGGALEADRVEARGGNGSQQIALRALGGDLQAGAISAGSLGRVELTAEGTIADFAGEIVALILEAEAGSDLVLDTMAGEVTALSRLGGDIFIREADSVMVHKALTPGGDVSIESGAALELEELTAGAGGSAQLNAGGAILQQTGLLSAGRLTVDARGAIGLLTEVEEAVLRSMASAAGSISVIEQDDILLEKVTASQGGVAVTSGGELAALVIELLSDNDAYDIALAAGSNLTVGMLQARTQGDVSLTAGGAITQQTDTRIIGDLLTATAQGNISLVTIVARLAATIQAAGNLQVDELNQLVLESVEVFDGFIRIDAGRNIDALRVICFTSSDFNDIELTSIGGDVAAGEIGAGALGTVNLAAFGNITDLPGKIIADTLMALARGELNLDTGVNHLSAESSVAGSILVTETDGIVLTSVRTFNGAVSVTADGTITALSVESWTDAAGNDVSLAATSGDVLIDFIKAGNANGGITIVAAGDIRELDETDDDMDATGHHLSMSPGGQIGSTANPELNPELDLSELIFFGEDLIHDYVGDVELNVVATGIVDVTATGTLTAAHLESGDGAITLNSTGGDIFIDYLDAGISGAVSLTAAGSILEDIPLDIGVDLVAAEAYFIAGVSIGGPHQDQGLETQVGTLVAVVTGSTIYLNEAGDIELVSVVAPDGEIVIVAGGNISISGPVSTSETAGHIMLETAEAVYMAGSDPATTYLLEVVAHSGIFLHTRVAMAKARIETAGILEIHEADAIVLQDVTNTNGGIYVIAGGDMTAGRIECLADDTGSNVGLMSLGGDLVVDYVAVGPENCQISLCAAGDIRQAANSDADVDLRGALGILYAEGSIDEGLDRSFKPIQQLGKKAKHHKKGKHGHKEALYEFERGKKLKLKNVQGDVELFVILENKVDVSATGDIHVAYLDSNGHGIDLRSKHGDTLIDHLETGPDKGDVELKAAGSVLLSGRLYSGDSGQICAGDDIAIFAGDDVRIFGSISAGNGFTTSSSKHCKGHKESPDVMIDSGSEVYIHAAVNSLDDVEIRADDGIFIDAGVTAVDDIEIGTCGDLTTSCDAPLSAGDDIEMWAAGQVTLAAALGAEDDVDIYSRSDLRITGNIRAEDDVGVYARGDIEVSADIEVWDRIYLSTRDNLTLLAGSSLGGINEEKARKVYLRAGDDMIFDGSIHAEKLYIC